MSTTTIYAEIVKAERNDDGDLVVVGKATGPDLDLDQQICDPAWLGKAMPDWFSTGGNIREQHSSIAAGVATEMQQQGDSWMVTSLVVDKGSAEKVEKKVLKGYSIGISNPRIVKDAAAPGGRIVDGSIVEVSLVDRPCNPTAMLSLAKAAVPGMQVKATDFDAKHNLIKTEEYVEIPEADDEPKAEVDVQLEVEANTEPEDTSTDESNEKLAGIVDAVKELVPNLGKSSSVEDIASAQEAIAIIGRIIVSEAESLAAGNLSDACDIDELLCAVRALKWFMAMEAEEPDEMITVPLAAEASTAKANEPATKSVLDDDDRITKLEKKFTEAFEASEERNKALEAELAKVKALPVQGGPVLTRTAQDTQKAASKDGLLAKAAHYRQMADTVSDLNARRGYLDLAAEVEANA